VADQRGFPAARQTHDAEYLTLLDFEADIRDPNYRVVSFEDLRLTEPFFLDGTQGGVGLGAENLPHIGDFRIAVKKPADGCAGIDSGSIPYRYKVTRLEA
jgi:hypothetical protein